MDKHKLAKSYLAQANIMQLATSVNDEPWACNIHFFCDDEFNFYWISTLDRQHSKDIEANPKVSAAILVHENTEDEPYVIGVSIAGKAERLGQTLPANVLDGYVDKLKIKPKLLNDIYAGRNPHNFYRLKADKIVLFDSKSFPDDPRVELDLGNK